MTKERVEEGAAAGSLDSETLHLWACEEYRNLNMHYFHEDDFFLKCTAHFMTINTGIVTIYGTKAIIELDEAVVLAMPVIGVATTVTWILTLLRVRNVKVGIEQRIEELEGDINDHWHASDAQPNFKLLRIRSKRRKGGAMNRISSTYIMSILPALFSLIWVFIVFKNAPRYAAFW